MTPEEYRLHKCSVQRARRLSNVEKARDYDRAWYRANPEKVRLKDRRSNLKRWHGITIEEFERLLTLQGGRCGICGSDDPKGMNGWELDHRHGEVKGTPQYVRGILCHPCNFGGGLFKDDPVLLLKAAEWFSKA